MANSAPIGVYLLCNAAFHDSDFARLELLKLLAEHEEINVRVGEDYRDIEAIAQSELLITYTCDVCPTPEQQQGLKQFLSGGKRWLALHATNALLGFVEEPREVNGMKLPGKGYSPDNAPLLMQLLGSRFLSHPAIEKMHIAVSDPSHPLVAGIEPFDVEDEPYYCEYFGEVHTLLESRYNSRAAFNVYEGPENDDPRPQLYLHPYGDGEVLYLTLGHCAGKYDMRPIIDVGPIRRCSWEVPTYYELLRRGIRWGIGELG